jgi:hypothetical protein
MVREDTNVIKVVQDKVQTWVVTEKITNLLFPC